MLACQKRKVSLEANEISRSARSRKRGEQRAVMVLIQQHTSKYLDTIRLSTQNIVDAHGDKLQ